MKIIRLELVSGTIVFVNTNYIKIVQENVYKHTRVVLIDGEVLDTKHDIDEVITLLEDTSSEFTESPVSASKMRDLFLGKNRQSNT
jgi:hypothetical protein